MTKTRQWSLFTAIAVLVVLAGGWMLLVSPQRAHAKDLDSQAASAENQTSALRAQLAQLLAQKRNLPQQQRLLAQVATKIPADPQEPTLIRQLQGAAHAAGVDLSSLSPSTPTAVVSAATSPATTTGTSTTAVTAPASSSQTLYQIPVAITVNGSYFNIEQFEYSLEKLPRALLVSGESIVPSVAGTTSTSGTATPTNGDVTASITATVFLAPPSQSAATSGTAASGTAASSNAK